MAVPVIASVGTFVTGNANSGTTQSIDMPTGLANSDLCVCVLSMEHNASGTQLAAPSGWLNAPDSPAFQAVSNGTASYVWYRVITNAGGEPASYAFPVQSGRYRRGGILRITGADTANPFDAGDGAVLASSTSTPAVSVTTTGVDRLAIWHAVSYNLSSWSTMPTGFTEHATWANASTDVSTLATRSVTTSGTAVGEAVATGVTAGKAAWVGAIASPASGPEAGRRMHAAH